MVGQHPSYVLVHSGTFCSGFFGDILIATCEGPLLYTEEIFWGSRPPCNDLCSILFRMAQYAIHGSCEAIQYTQGSWSYDHQFPIKCTLHPHTLLIECNTHIYAYILYDTVDIWVGGEALTFWPRWVYMSILTL